MKTYKIVAQHVFSSARITRTIEAATWDAAKAEIEDELAKIAAADPMQEYYMLSDYAAPQIA